MIFINMKVCTKCNIEKDLTEFSKGGGQYKKSNKILINN